MWPLGFISEDRIKKHKKTLLVPRLVIIHIETALYQVFYIVDREFVPENKNTNPKKSKKEVIFKSRFMANSDYWRHKHLGDIPPRDKLALSPETTLQEALDLLNCFDLYTPQLATENARRKFSNRFPKQKMEDYDWIVNYELFGFHHFRIQPNFEAMLLIAGCQ